MKVAVIGAGPTGLAAALQMLKRAKDLEIDLYEANNSVGGFSRSFYLFDHIVDLGPHRFFTQDRNVMDFWVDLAEKRCHKVYRKTRIYYENQMVGYPIAAGDLLRALPLKTKIKIFSSFLKRKLHEAGDGENFSSTMRYRFGDKLYELFFKDYTERLWGVSDDLLSASLAYQRIGGFGLAHAIKHAVRGCFKKIEDTFFYPTLGCGQVWETAAERLQALGCKLHLATAVSGIAQNKAGYAVTSKHGTIHYDHVLSTIPMTRFIQIYKNMPEHFVEKATALSFRSTILVYVEVQGEPHFDDQWIYVNSKTIRTGRITNFSNWGIEHNDKKDTHVLCLEYWCTAGDEFWSESDQGLFDIAKTDLNKLHYLPALLQRTHVVRLANTYPVITNEAETLMDSFSIEMSKHAGLQTVGRGGAFKYNNQDHCIEMGLRAAENVLGENHNTWTVNSKKSYLENALIDSAVPPG